MTSGKKVMTGAITVVVLLGIIAIWHVMHKPVNPIVTPTGNSDHTSAQNVGNFDQFQQDLATRVLQKFGDGTSGSDFSVIVATTAYPLGTLLRPTGSVPADLEDCVPIPLPKPYSAQRLFPSYTMSSDTAITANIGSRALQGLDSAGVNLSQSSKIQYTVTDTQIQIMDDKSVEQVTGHGNCGKYIAAHPGMRLIRGSVIGKMSFIVQVDNPASVKAQLAKIGGFSVNDNPQASTLSIADDQSQPIVELLSEFGTSENASTSPTTPKPIEAGTSSGRSLASVEKGAHMYIQEDATDTPEDGTKVVQLLRKGWPTATIESKVQRIPTQKMPEAAQVRYFNASDEAFANRCVEILKQAYPNARVVRIGLPSPKGQLEVWLPRKR
jgi:hypothetical protein